MSSVKWSDKSLKFLSKLDEKDAKRIVKKVDRIKENPLRYIKGLVNRDFGKIRAGDYRLFVDFYIKENELVIRTIKHRKNAYKE